MFVSYFRLNVIARNEDKVSQLLFSSKCEQLFLIFFLSLSFSLSFFLTCTQATLSLFCSTQLQTSPLTAFVKSIAQHQLGLISIQSTSQAVRRKKSRPSWDSNLGLLGGKQESLFRTINAAQLRISIPPLFFLNIPKSSSWQVLQKKTFLKLQESKPAPPSHEPS